MICALFIATVLTAAASGADFVVIANHTLRDVKISARALKQIYLGTKTSLRGERVEPVLARSGMSHETFVSELLGKTETGLRNYFRNLVFTGKGSMPRSFADSAAMVAYVSRTPGGDRIREQRRGRDRRREGDAALGGLS